MDVGKARLPDGLLNKPGLLLPAERVELRKHVDYSIEILSAMPEVPSQVLQMVAEHHERFDGSGYPNQLAGKAISPLARLQGMVDTYDAMTSERPYARALPLLRRFRVSMSCVIPSSSRSWWKSLFRLLVYTRQARWCI
jgi:HD-GYP domain-containing protein (c-di-GMP phosphodiesterase class II)